MRIHPHGYAYCMDCFNTKGWDEKGWAEKGPAEKERRGGGAQTKLKCIQLKTHELHRIPTVSIKRACHFRCHRQERAGKRAL